MIVGLLFKAAFFREGTEVELMPLMKHFLAEVNKSQKAFVAAAPDTLFVFAAGNDGTDNDVLPAAPASVGGDNVISVAASFGNVKIAKFSNYGKLSVDIAAPGVFINSAIPVNRYMEVSGTSQAAPRVAAAAAQIMEMNNKLTPKEVKQILMGTVDYKDYLKSITVSGGVLNQERAVYAASYARSASLEEAIIVARTKVLDLAKVDPSLTKGSSQSVTAENSIVPIEMPSGFDLESFKKQF
jgi:subtilisin family serine protease